MSGHISEKLKEECPLLPDWEVGEVLDEESRIQGCSIFLSGISAKSHAGEVVTGSAGSSHASPLSRAYYELVERMATASARHGTQPHFTTLDNLGNPKGEILREEVFPVSPEPALWRFSYSNGIASHSRRELAIMKAVNELVERDRLLRSWEGEFAPVPLCSLLPSIPQPLREAYSFQAYEFPSVGYLDKTIHVRGVFAFPHAPGASRAYGASAAVSPDQALTAASEECLQAIGFLHGCDVEENPIFSPTPDYHQEYYLNPNHFPWIKSWLRGEFYREERCPSLTALEDVTLVDLTPSQLQGKFHVIKAMSNDVRPLRFGRLPRQMLHPFV